MYQELQRKKTELQLKKPYDKVIAEQLKKLDMLDYISGALIMEGTILSRGDIEGMLEGEMPKTASLKECIFVKNYMNLMEIIRDNLELKCNLDAKLLLKFQNELTGEKDGFRRSNMVSDEFSHVPPHFSDVEAKLNQLFYSVYRSKEDEIHNAARIHCGILEIYPFEEYSAVMARLAMNYYLQEKGFLPVALGYSGDEYISTMATCLKDKNDALFFWGLERAEFNKMTQVIQIIECAEEE